ncbi:MAG: glycosyltransferase family 1 protein [Vicinamibacterales bacterium]|nr:glycosyltransferase family 1 protein [Vicinamibacterales bacterium]
MVAFSSVRIVVDYRPALVERTGVGELVHELAAALGAPEGPLAPADALTLFTSSRRDRPSAGLAAAIGRAHVVDRRIPVRALTWAWHHLEWPPIERLAGACDVAVSPTPLLVPTRRAAQVVTINDLDFLAHPERTHAEMRRDYPRLVHAHTARADAVLVISEHTAREATRQLGLPAGRLHLCRPGAPVWAPEVIAARAGVGDRIILFLGTLEPRKNVGTLLDAYERLVDRHPGAPRLVLAGRVTPAAAAWVERAGRGRLTGRVDVRGYVSEAERRRLLAAAVVLVLPSHDEGFGIPVLEAMACEVPVVVSNRGALPEVAGDAGAIVEPEDVEAMADAMARLLDPAAAVPAIARGRVQAGRFTWAAAARAAYGACTAAVATRAARQG